LGDEDADDDGSDHPIQSRFCLGELPVVVQEFLVNGQQSRTPTQPDHTQQGVGVKEQTNRPTEGQPSSHLHTRFVAEHDGKSGLVSGVRVLVFDVFVHFTNEDDKDEGAKHEQRPVIHFPTVDHADEYRRTRAHRDDQILDDEPVRHERVQNAERPDTSAEEPDTHVPHSDRTKDGERGRTQHRDVLAQSPLVFVREPFVLAQVVHPVHQIVERHDVPSDSQEENGGGRHEHPRRVVEVPKSSDRKERREDARHRPTGRDELSNHSTPLWSLRSHLMRTDL